MSKFTQFPKTKKPLPLEHHQIFEKEYLLNRSRGSLASRLSGFFESWMHRQIAMASQVQGEDILEIGAGTLNHLHWEKNYRSYDVIEPTQIFIDASDRISEIRTVYRSLLEVAGEKIYDRVLSVAVLEHMDDLPKEVARSALLLKDNGVFCAGVPSEGALLWYLAWKYGTGLSFKLRTGLDYSVLMKTEHVNNVTEIAEVIQWFFKDVKIVRYPFPYMPLSLYTVFKAQRIHRDRCLAEIGYEAEKL